MIGYGLIKVFALQMLKPQLQQLVAPLGDLTRMGLVWTFMGISPVYQSFTGAAEVMGGLLLFWRRTRLLGATIVAVVMTNVVLLNFLYDIPVKLNPVRVLGARVPQRDHDGRRGEPQLRPSKKAAALWASATSSRSCATAKRRRRCSPTSCAGRR